MRDAAVLALMATMLLSGAEEAVSGAWTLAPGQTKTFVASSFTYGDHGFDDAGKLVRVPEYRKFELSARLEYGVRQWLTAIAHAELREDRVDTPVTPTLIAPVSHSFGSIAGGARLRLHKAPNWVFSTQLLASSGGFDSALLGDPSDGPYVEGRALVGASRTVAGKPMFVDLQAAYRVRTNGDDADEIRIDATVGARVLPRWTVLAQSFSTFEVSEETQYHKLSVGVVRQITDRLQMEVSGLVTVYGRNAVRETGGKIAFWYDY